MNDVSIRFPHYSRHSRCRSNDDSSALVGLPGHDEVPRVEGEQEGRGRQSADGRRGHGGRNESQRREEMSHCQDQRVQPETGSLSPQNPFQRACLT